MLDVELDDKQERRKNVPANKQQIEKLIRLVLKAADEHSEEGLFHDLDQSDWVGIDSLSRVHFPFYGLTRITLNFSFRTDPDQGAYQPDQEAHQPDQGAYQADYSDSIQELL